MKKILIASNNTGKIKEIVKLLEGSNRKIVWLEKEGIEADPDETGHTFEENALIKARFVHSIANIPVIADDSGLQVDILNGRPGVQSKRYAGPDATDDENNKKVSNEIKNMGKSSSPAAFVCCLAYIDENGSEFLFKGNCRGKFITKPRGSNGFGYDPYFYINELGATMAELTDDQKNTISHRGKALEKFAEFLKETDK